MDKINNRIKKAGYSEDELNDFRKQIEYFLSLQNDNYLNFLRDKLGYGNKTIFDTNIYSPIPYNFLFAFGNDNLEESVERVFNKAFDYQERLLDLLNDKRVIATRDIIEEMEKAPKSLRLLIDRDVEKFDKSIRTFLKEKVRRYAANIPLFYNFLSSNRRVINVNDYNMNQYYDFKIMLRKLFDITQHHYNLKRPISEVDKNIIYTMINESFSEPTSVISRDFDLFLLVKMAKAEIYELNEKLKRFVLRLNEEQYIKCFNTFVLSSEMTRINNHNKSLPYLTSKA